MKSIKMIGLAALAALMAMAFVGASSAMAEETQLCSADESPCLTENVITHVHEETLAGAKAKLLSSLGTVECTALFLGSSLGSGAPLVIHGHYTYTSCTRGTESCTVAEKSTDSLLKVLRTGVETAEETFAFEISVHCGLFINCTYNGEGLIGIVSGPLTSGPNGSATINEQTLHIVSGICPSTGKLDISTMPLVKVYIVKGGPMSCVLVAGGLYRSNNGGGVCIEDVNRPNGNWELVN